ncbi:MAG TPA: hypothetical protein VGB17_14240 [Pyrinomonadaceae bacterium]|jgi:hypothetical protein
MKVILVSEGNTCLEIEDDIAGDDAMLRKALSTAVPYASNAEIKREGGEVRVIKKAAPKGHASEAVAMLARAPEHVNPAIMMHRRLHEMEDEAGHLSSRKLAGMRKEMELACEQGRIELCEVVDALEALQESAAEPGLILPVGF